jgi:predicted glycoside hydrolase/deacetylase ChbG (UPF0249 family)
VIRNADDFGYRAEVSRAIVEAFEAGLVTSTSLMANQEGFEEACTLARERGFADGVGAHLVLTRGEPLTEEIRRFVPFCDGEGRFVEWRGSGSIFRLGSTERNALARELRAQIARCRAAGFAVAHLDSHHHVHNEWAVGGVVIALARELGIRRVRVARNCGRGIGLVNRAYKRLFNVRLGRAGLAGTRYFGDIEDWLYLKAGGADDAALADFELMTHPVWAGGEVVDAELGGQPLAKLLAPLSGLPSGVPGSK